MRLLVLVVAAVAAACSKPDQSSAVRKQYLAALEGSKKFNYRKSVGDQSKLESRVTPRPDNFIEDFPTDENYFYDAPRNQGCFDVSISRDTAIAVVKSECENKTWLKRQKLLWRGDTLRFVAFDVLQSNEIYEIKLTSEVEFDQNGRYRRHRLKKNYRLKVLNLQLSAQILGERAD